MDLLTTLLAVAAVVICVVLLIKIIAAPVKLAFKLLLNAGTGLLILIAVNLVGGFLDFSLDISVINALIAGILGVPGVILLIALKIFF